MNDNIIVTRHTGLVEWLAREGIQGEVVAHVSDPAQIAGRHVYGVLPLHLAAQAASLTTVDLSGVPAEFRGQDLTPNQMDQFGATLRRYVVIDVTDGPACDHPHCKAGRI